MANHINHYKSLKKKHTKSKREEIPKHCSIYPSTLFALFFVLFFFIFLLLVFLQWFHFFSLKPFFPRIVLLFAVATVFRISYKNNFFPHFFYFPLLSRHFLNWFVCVLHFHSHLTLRSCHIIYALFSFFLLFSLCLCLQWILFIRRTIVRMVTREFTLFMSWRLFETSQLYCTVLE